MLTSSRRSLTVEILTFAKPNTVFAGVAFVSLVTLKRPNDNVRIIITSLDHHKKKTPDL